jgi:FlaA1/EpsC-like NDP-sugar epimerase
VNAIRDVEFRDLLGRNPVHLDQEKIGFYLEGKTVLVSGAGGSIGRGLCRQICRFSPDRIILFERAESSLYEIDLELRNHYGQVRVTSQLGDVQRLDELEKSFGLYRPQIVFHAAAYKHVPMLEAHPWQAVENNIMGTANLVEMAERHGCERFVFVSTDKAVNPTSVMGASKRVAEMIVQSRNRAASSACSFITVRFGNVIGSVGSVVPLFKEQIKNGGPVTVTHPDVVRYFMLIPEACQLILQAAAMGEGGEIFILEMGEPVRIDDMARDLIRFSGFEPDVDIKVEYIGLRPGEKLYEELMTDSEDILPTGHEKIRVLNSAAVDIPSLNGHLSVLSSAAKERDERLIRSCLREILPEYRQIFN